MKRRWCPGDRYWRGDPERPANAERTSHSDGRSSRCCLGQKPPCRLYFTTSGKLLENADHLRIWQAWHQASLNRDQEALLALYAEDAVLEAPLIPVILHQQSGIVNGRDSIRRFLECAREAGAPSSDTRMTMHWWRENKFFSVGNTLIWEYPRLTPDGDQMDIVEVMVIIDGMIGHHKVYWGWHLTTMLLGT